MEAGSDARYLADMMRSMAKAPAFLDSEDLVDLRVLFEAGVHATWLKVPRSPCEGSCLWRRRACSQPYEQDVCIPKLRPGGWEASGGAGKAAGWQPPSLTAT